MTEDELMMMKEEFEKDSNIKINKAIYTETYQYLIGKYKEQIFCFGTHLDIVFLKGLEMDCKTACELMKLISEKIEVKPLSFSEEKGIFTFIWPNYEQQALYDSFFGAGYTQDEMVYSLSPYYEPSMLN